MRASHSCITVRAAQRGDDPSSFVKRERFESVMLRVLKSQNLKDSEVLKDSEETILRAFQA